MFKEICSGPVKRVEVLVTFSNAEVADGIGIDWRILDSLTDLSKARREMGFRYLNWAATPAIFGTVDSDIRPAVNLSAQTHPHFHEGMTNKDFQDLVMVYMINLRTYSGISILSVNFLPEHPLVIIQIDPNDTGRNSA